MVEDEGEVLKIERGEGETCVTPLKYIPSYGIFYNIFGDSKLKVL
jgi:hypothetical protein